MDNTDRAIGWSFAYFCSRCWWLQESDPAARALIIPIVCPNCGHDQAERPVYGADLAELQKQVDRLAHGHR
jgi:DNA-directed RNA polymerase subunit RPC12/RpoP